MGCGFGTWGLTVVTSTGKMSMTFKNLLHKRVGLFGSQQCCENGFWSFDPMFYRNSLEEVPVHAWLVFPCP